MKCRNCGAEVGVNINEVCAYCSKKPLDGDSYCHSCGSTTQPGQTMCTECQTILKSGNSSNRPTRNHVVDEENGLANVASCCFPIVGIVLYFVWKDEKPTAAKGVCTWTIVGFSITVIYYLVQLSIGFASY